MSQTTYILHGGATSRPCEWNDRFFKKIVEGLPSGATVLVVYFAVTEDRWPSLLDQDRERFERFANQAICVELAQKDTFMKQVREADAIYLRGGHTPRLLEEVKKHPGFVDAIKGKVIAGSSAGVYILSTYYHSTDQGGVFAGLGVLPIRSITHSDEGDPARIEALNAYPQELELVRIPETEFRIMTI